MRKLFFGLFLTCLLYLTVWSSDIKAKNLVKFQGLNNINSSANPAKSTQELLYELKLAGPILQGNLAFDADIGLDLPTASVKYSLSEFYYQKQFSRFGLKLGRVRLDWSKGLNYWGLGKLNSKRNFGHLDAKEEGILGIYINKRIKKNLHFELLFSYLHMPQINPGLYVEDRMVKGHASWIKLPPKRTVLPVAGFKRTVPIYYKVNMPDIEKVMFNKSLGANLTYSPFSFLKMSTFIVYKPENKIRVNAEAYYNLAEDAINVTANPIVNHHLLLGAKLNFKKGPLSAVTGFNINDPNAKIGKDFALLDPMELKQQNRTFESEYFKIAPRYEKESYWYSSLKYTAAKYKIALSFVQILTDNIRNADDFFSETAMWKQAIGTKFEFDIFKRLKLNFDFKHDFKTYDNLLRSQLAYSFKGPLQLLIGVDLIKSTKLNSYWYNFRGNDIIYSNLSYQF